MSAFQSIIKVPMHAWIERKEVGQLERHLILSEQGAVHECVDMLVSLSLVCGITKPNPFPAEQHFKKLTRFSWNAALTFCKCFWDRNKREKSACFCFINQTKTLSLSSPHEQDPEIRHCPDSDQAAALRQSHKNSPLSQRKESGFGTGMTCDRRNQGQKRNMREPRVRGKQKL